MRCNKGARKHRFSRTGKGNPSDYAKSNRGHTWKRENNKTICSLCGYVKKIYPKCDSITKGIYRMNSK